MPSTTKNSPARRRPRLKPLPIGPVGSTPMTPEVKLAMKPVYDLLEQNGIAWRKIPESEFKVAVGMWRRDRISRAQWRVDWQPDGENFVLEYARSHKWKDPDVVRDLAETVASGCLTEAQWASMTHEEWLEWEASTVQ